MNKEERLTSGNINIYEEHAKYCVSIFETWKLAQLKRKKQGDKHWNKSFLAHQTYKKLRISVCGFFHFARYMAETVFFEDGELSYVPMLASNQSSLEGRFSSLCHRGHDKGNTFGGGVGFTNNKQVMSALASKSASYDHNDTAREDTSLEYTD